ncbi:four helix bundle protein [Methylotuvimicrobium buryatense]|uniref:Four helix bundle protein n=2 Tax=Methylotuvimicrobium buryatense TaxID=95641 RepID=A0A4P9UR42_METBY|nr:four helix bundle protein [Methylotuvimicrobium buryatense]QCW82781.1 four helix bundle protein [Methylotuvimicrobium buryatense]
MNGVGRFLNGKDDTRPHYQLQAWQLSMSLVKLVYVWSKGFPVEEKYGLQSQIRRAAISVPSNIAEGAGRKGSKEFAHFLSIAQGSLSELETQYLIAIDLGFAQASAELENTLVKTAKLVSGLYRFHQLRK